MIPAKRVYFLLTFSLIISPILEIFFNKIIGVTIPVVFDTIVLALMIIDSRKVKRDRVQVTRLLPGRLSIGRDNPIYLEIKSGNTPANIIISDYYPIDFITYKNKLEAFLPAKSYQELTYTVQPKNRGEYKWGDIQIRQLGSWGLAWDDWKIKDSKTVAVYPDLVGLRELTIKLTLQNTGTMRQARRIGMGTEFAELREYGIGDDIRLIDWKATARRSRPLVRVLEPEQEQTLIILLDRGRLMTARIKGIKRFDWGLNATLSLTLAGLHRGDRVGIAVFDKEITTWIPPERGHHQLNRILERLTPIQPALLEPDYLGACTTIVKQQSRRALVVVITDIIDITASSELLAALGRLTPRYLPFCVTLRDPQIDKIAHTPTEDISSTYSRAVALDLLSQRQVAFAKLKQKGVLVLDAPANHISNQLVNRYLQLKARNQL